MTSTASIRLLMLSLMACSAGLPASGTGGGAAGQQTPLAPIAGGPMQPTAPSPSLDVRRATLDLTLVRAYAQRLAPMLVGRSLNAQEDEALTREGGAGLPSLIESWSREPGFSGTARDWVSTKLKASGTRDGVNLNLPGNLAAYLAKNRLPHSELLVANFCIDDEGQKTACDTGAPFSSGILTTRAFLANNASRFNLKRARTVLRSFGCADYPMPAERQPPLPREVLIPLFKQDKKEDDASGTFGNGFACYACHSQFGAHAQPFVKFDADGKYVADATGIQLAGGEQGRSTGKLFASHMSDPQASADESSQIFGKPVKNLAGMGQAYVETDAFWSCSVGSLMGYIFGLADSTVFALPKDVLTDIVSAAKAKEAQPSLATLSVEAFSHPAVVKSLQ
jgi:Protein of unknown function (DUF1588)